MQPLQGIRSAENSMKKQKRLGQHFLEDSWVKKLINAVQVSSGDTFLEIGAGLGALTLPVAMKARKVIAVEIDTRLSEELKTKTPENVEVITADFLKINLEKLLESEKKPIRVIGNLPYKLSSPILFRLTATHNSGLLFSDATLMLQHEVAERLVAVPGNKLYGVLAIQISLHAERTKLLRLPPGAFRPQPKVTSSVVNLHFHSNPFDANTLRVFEWLTRGLFMQRRKTLANSLQALISERGLNSRQVLSFLDINPTRRPETLKLDEISALARHLCYIFQEPIKPT